MRPAARIDSVILRTAVRLVLPLTVLVVAATGHHWWLDGIVAITLLLVGLRLDTFARARAATRRRAAAPAQLSR